METGYKDLKAKKYSDSLTIEEYRKWVNSSAKGVTPLPSKARWRL